MSRSIPTMKIWCDGPSCRSWIDIDLEWRYFPTGTLAPGATGYSAEDVRNELARYGWNESESGETAFCPDCERKRT